MSEIKPRRITRLEQLRIDAGLTPEELSAKSGVSRATISRIEAGAGSTPATLRKLAIAFLALGEPVKPSELQVLTPEERAA